jgi:hypothetical protein
MSQVASKVHDFTLTLSGADELTAEVADALYEAGCDDASVHSHGATLFATFHREAPSFDEAVASARADVARAGLGLTVIGVEAEPA